MRQDFALPTPARRPAGALINGDHSKFAPANDRRHSGNFSTKGSAQVALIYRPLEIIAACQRASINHNVSRKASVLEQFTALKTRPTVGLDTNGLPAVNRQFGNPRATTEKTPDEAT